ncbi:LysE family transporter [Kiloniella laminariae]|uniref:LysE family transporter n=1 Tax=Kiloniella laminariae TaxID=454162 RepID=A0ABT4LGN5_9PROT|nr:LysE family transporter [Kiloniella laminariae]MCZ4279162.1 LysE family transporter [Kiloniella laminariae]
MLILIIKGLLIGLAVAAPVGPMALLCLKFSLERGLSAGIATGFGIALADMSYGIIALLGLTAITSVLLDYNDIIRTVGGTILLLMAGFSLLKILRDHKRPAVAKLESRKSSRLLLIFTSAYALTMTNPMTILTFLAIFAGLGAEAAQTERWIIASGIFVGSLGWWFCIAATGALLRTRLSTGTITAINLLSAVIIGGFGTYVLLS